MRAKKKQKDRKVNKGSKLRRLFIIGVCFFLLAIIFNFYQGHLKQKRMNKRITSLESEIDELTHTKNKLQEQINHINSKKFIEQIAREELGLVKKGEILYITVEK